MNKERAISVDCAKRRDDFSANYAQQCDDDIYTDAESYWVHVSHCTHRVEVDKWNYKVSESNIALQTSIIERPRTHATLLQILVCYRAL